MPPYELHKDTGTITLAHIKRSLRDYFDMLVRHQVLCQDGTSLSIRSEESASVGLFHITSHALYKGASRLTDFLRACSTSCSVDLDFHMHKRVDRLSVRSSFLPSRLANLILELSWRTVALNEAKPAIRIFSPRATTVHQTMYSHIDDVMLEALREWNGDGATSTSSMHPQQNVSNRAAEFQVYLTQLTALRFSIGQLVGRSQGKCIVDAFAKSISYLQEAVEVERMQQANRLTETVGDSERSAREPSVISSMGLLDYEDGEQQM